MTNSILVPAVLGGDVASQAAEAVPEVVIRHREVPADWEARLREFSPISESISWLALNYHWGTERWFVYECVPDQFIESSFRAELEGSDPDTLDEWARIATKYQWEMYRKYRVHARLCWIIQGDKGGHKFQFSPTDKEIARACGLPGVPPRPGTLPYADFDERVVRQLTAMSKLAAVGNDMAEFKKIHGTVEGQRRYSTETLREARKMYVRYINDQFSDGDELFASAYRKGELDNAPRTTKDFVKEDEDADRNYIERGRFA